jgi:protein-S-isoprenylcysteine O-methyltransferase Ste14
LKTFTQTGKYLFRYRAAIAAVFFIVLVVFAKPVASMIAHIFVITGIALRLWAAGYIGPAARKRNFHTKHRICSGPYHILKHPLYVGNFFLVLGVIILYNPLQWLGFLYMVTFVVIYTSIAISERYYLKGKSEIETSYRFMNLKGEISTLIVMAVIYAVWFLLMARS